MILIRKLKVCDKSEIVDICYKTGYMGEDLTGLHVFKDKVLFGYLFCLYYVKYEMDNCFVAVDAETNRVVGYILGTADTQRQRKKIILKMGWKIVLRFLFVTLWKYPESARAVLYFIKDLDLEQGTSLIYNEYPAHLHINILKDYQRLGLGEKLLASFEGHIKNYAKGIHLVTTNKNSKAVPFYYKNGYKIIEETPAKMWEGVSNSVSMIFAKKFSW